MLATSHPKHENSQREVIILSDSTRDKAAGISLRTARKLLFIFFLMTAGVGYSAFKGEVVLPTLSPTGWLIPSVLWVAVMTAMFMWDVSENKSPEDRSVWKPNWILEMMRNA